MIIVNTAPRHACEISTMKRELIESYARAQVPRYTSYPTAAQFSSAINGDVVAQWAAALSDDARLSLYFHVPFCRSICWYCGCHTKATRKDGPLISYGQTLERELESSALAFAHGRKGPRQVVSIHWGGGTPSLLPADVFQEIVDCMRNCYSVSEDAEHAMELDPRLIELFLQPARGFEPVTLRLPARRHLGRVVVSRGRAPAAAWS